MNYSIILFFLLSALSFQKVNAQSLLFDNLDQYVCVIDSSGNYLDLQFQESLKLMRIDSDNRQLLSDKIIIVFNEEMEIVKCDGTGHELQLLASFPYFINRNKGILTVEYSNEIKIDYKAGIISTGSIAYLYRSKKQKH